MASNGVPAALDRVADSLFALGKSYRESVALQKRAVAVAEASLEAQTANLAVTKALEANLTAQLPVPNA